MTQTAAPWNKKKATDATQDNEEVAAVPIPESLALSVPDAAGEDSAVAVSMPTQHYSSDEGALSLSDVMIPRLRLANGLSKEVQQGEAKPGQWLLMGNAPETKAEIVVFSMGKIREYRDPQENSTVLCKSDDAVVGHGNPGGLCETCPMAQWGEKNPKTGKSKPAPCSFAYTYRAYSLTHQSLCLLDLKRTSLDAARQINTLLMMKKFKNFVLILGSTQKQGPQGNYFIPTVSSRALTAEERAAVNEYTGL